MKPLLIIFGVFLLLTLVVAGAYLGFTALSGGKGPTQITVPAGFTNPFVDKPDSGFAGSQSQSVNPFAEPTPTYQNPFGTTQSGSQPYQNPFEALR